MRNVALTEEIGMFHTPAHKQLDPAKQAGQIVNRVPAQVFGPICDFLFSDHHSICLLQPLSAAGRAWVQDNIDNHMTWGGSIAIEPRYADDILAGIESDGLRVA